MFIFNNFSTCFGHHYAHLQENKTYVTACVVLRWFCWMWLVAVVGRCLVGCEHCEGYCSMMPETCWEIVKNKHLTLASCWFSLSLHNLLTMHGHRNLKIRIVVTQRKHKSCFFHCSLTQTSHKACGNNKTNTQHAYMKLQYVCKQGSCAWIIRHHAMQMYVRTDKLHFHEILV